MVRHETPWGGSRPHGTFERSRPPSLLFDSIMLTADMSPEELIDLALNSSEAAAELERRYRSIVAVLVVDFSSMRARTDAFGIIHTLATVRAAFRAYRPAIEANGGQTIMSVADTHFAVFEGPEQALVAALDGHRLMREFNADRQGDICKRVPHAPIFPRSGLGFGDALVFDDQNLFGAEVNRAFILGEDVATNQEILASRDFVAALGSPPQGVGVHAAPHDREVEAGFPFHIYTDFR